MKKIQSLILASFLFFYFYNYASASIVRVSQNGEIIVNVLSSQNSVALEIPKSESIETRIVNEVDISRSTQVNLSVKNGDARLKVTTNGQERELDLTNFKDDIIEIEETPQKTKVKIFVKDGRVYIQEGETIAVTDYTLSVDSENNRLSLTTDTGDYYLAIFPKEAVESALRAKLVDEIAVGNNLTLVEENGNLVYKIPGKKILNILNITKYSMDVETHVAASNGEITFTNEPVWLKVLGILLN